MVLRTKWMALFCVFILAVCALLTKSAYADVQYVVNPGDTLWGIGQRFHTTASHIRDTNHLQSDLIQIHQRLSIGNEQVTQRTQHFATQRRFVKHPAFHRVTSGDSLWNIAMDNHVTVDQLKSMNNLFTDTIYPGQELLVDVHKAHRLMSTVQLKKALQSGVPKQLIAAYVDAGRKYGIPWTILAAIHHEETRFSTGYHVSSCGALGPMQFMPSTFAEYGVAAPGNHGRPDINNVYDAIYSAANMLHKTGYSSDPSRALYAYNHSMYYVYSVRRFAQGM